MNERNSKRFVLVLAAIAVHAACAADKPDIGSFHSLTPMLPPAAGIVEFDAFAVFLKSGP